MSFLLSVTVIVWRVWCGLWVLEDVQKGVDRVDVGVLAKHLVYGVGRK